MNSEPELLPEEKQRRLHERLPAPWTADTWTLTLTPANESRQIQFSFQYPSFNIELKYALWQKLVNKRGKKNTCSISTFGELKHIMTWLHHCHYPTRSLMEQNLEQWENSLSSYLLQTGHFWPQQKKTLLATQQYVVNDRQENHICHLRQIYTVIKDAYDDRSAEEKDIWDMRAMGLAVDLTLGSHLLNFTFISQSWLRCLAKEFVKFSAATHSPADCKSKLATIRSFSCFLMEQVPDTNISDIDRATILKYLTYLREQHMSDTTKEKRLQALRTILETCAHQLQMEGLTREQLIFDDDIPKRSRNSPKDIPQEVLEKLRQKLDTLPTVISRMVVILLECGLRIGELCNLPLDCLLRDNKHEWYLHFYQKKSKKDHLIPLVNDTVVAVIQVQQEGIRKQWGERCCYLFPSLASPDFPFKQITFNEKLNTWAVQVGICDSAGKLYHFHAHQFRHTVGMRLITENVSLDTIKYILGHRELRSTQIYAYRRAENLRKELERIARKRKTIDAQGQVVKGDDRANDPDTQLLRREIRGQTLPIGGCGRPVLQGDCEHANKCASCPFWLTSTDDLPSLKIFYRNALRLKQKAVESGNQMVVNNQERIIPILALRIARLERTDSESSLSLLELISQLQANLVDAESALEEAQGSGLLVAEKCLKRIVADLKANITALEETL
jgi:integrase